MTTGRMFHTALSPSPQVRHSASTPRLDLDLMRSASESVWNGRLPRHPHLCGSFTCAVNGGDIRKEGPAVSSIAHRGFVHLGMDVSKDSIAVAVLSPDRDSAEVDKIFHDTDSVRRLVKRLGKPKGDLGLLRSGPDRL
jgi:hypothetical protein